MKVYFLAFDRLLFLDFNLPLPYLFLFFYLSHSVLSKALDDSPELRLLMSSPRMKSRIALKVSLEVPAEPQW